MEWFNQPKFIFAFIILLLSVGFDLRTRKVPNKFILVFSLLALIFIFISEGFSSYTNLLSSLAAATVFGLPLYMIHALGAGDVKLIMGISMLLNWQLVISIIITSLVWGSVLGLVQIVLQGKLKELVYNLFFILKRKGPPSTLLTKIPYTVAIFFGFLTSLSIEKLGGLWV